MNARGKWRIRGRIKNLIVLNSGHKTAPEPIEENIARLLPAAQQVVIVGNGRGYLGALIAGSVEAAAVQAALNLVNRELPHYRQVRKFELLGNAFTPESGLLTANGKLRRDAVNKRYAAEINGFSSVALTKLDVLDALDEIKVCTGYRLDGQPLDSFPAVSQDLRRIEPVYATLPGWKTSTEGITEIDALPAEARSYVEFLSSEIGVEIGLISTGPERGQTIVCQDSTLAKWIEV